MEQTAGEQVMDGNFFSEVTGVDGPPHIQEVSATLTGYFGADTPDQGRIAAAIPLTHKQVGAVLRSTELTESAERRLSGDIEYRFRGIGIHLTYNSHNLLQANFYKYRLGTCNLTPEYDLRFRRMSDAEMVIFESAFAKDLPSKAIAARQKFLKIAFSSGIPKFDELLKKLQALSVYPR